VHSIRLPFCLLNADYQSTGQLFDACRQRCLGFMKDVALRRFRLKKRKLKNTILSNYSIPA
jgi:hypothetical protein